MKKVKRQRELEPGELKCGCVYSIVGYALYLCPKHDPERVELMIAEADRREKGKILKFGVAHGL